MNNLNVPMQGTLKAKAVTYRRSMGKNYAFVTCIDVLESGKGTNEKRYWGEVFELYNPEEIFKVMCWGGKWDNLP
jgi:hypothetical protein